MNHAPDERPWTAKGFSIEDRAMAISERFELRNMVLDAISEAIEAACRDALADAGPRWQTTDTLPPAAIAKDYDRIKRYSADCWVYDGAEVQQAVYSYKTSKWMDASGDRINGVTHWQYVIVPPAPEETP